MNPSCVRKSVSAAVYYSVNTTEANNRSADGAAAGGLRLDLNAYGRGYSLPDFLGSSHCIVCSTLYRQSEETLHCAVFRMKQLIPIYIIICVLYYDNNI